MNYENIQEAVFALMNQHMLPSVIQKQLHLHPEDLNTLVMDFCSRTSSFVYGSMDKIYVMGVMLKVVRNPYISKGEVKIVDEAKHIPFDTTSLSIFAAVDVVDEAHDRVRGHERIAFERIVLDQRMDYIFGLELQFVALGIEYRIVVGGENKRTTYLYFSSGEINKWIFRNGVTKKALDVACAAALRIVHESVMDSFRSIDYHQSY